MPARRKSVVRYAVVGLGYIAQAAVLPAFSHARSNSRLVAIVSGDREKRAALARALALVWSGELSDAKSALALLQAAHRLGRL